jgi:hypothetical protein
MQISPPEHWLLLLLQHSAQTPLQRTSLSPVHSLQFPLMQTPFPPQLRPFTTGVGVHPDGQAFLPVVHSLPVLQLLEFGTQLGWQVPFRQVPSWLFTLQLPLLVPMQRFIAGLQVSHWPLQASQHSLVDLHCWPHTRVPAGS